MKIFLIDDEESIRIGVGDDLKRMGHEVYVFNSPVNALSMARLDAPDCVLCDLKMPEMDGTRVLEEIQRIGSQIIVIIITAHGDIESAVRCIKQGAFDYLTKPFSTSLLEAVLEKISAFIELKNANRSLQEALQEKFSFHNIVGKSEVMKKVFGQIEMVSGTEGTVLIVGETGTGKDLVAKAIHYNSGRKNGPLIKCVCSVFSNQLLESELFGHEKGAFTGAIRQKKGRFELADRGSIFLDEIDDIPLESQVKLLRFLEERTFERVGGEVPLTKDVRIIVASKVNLIKLVEEEVFRSDLYYRLNVLPVFLPPLRERRDDIPLLVNHFLKKYSGERMIELCPEAVNLLMRYSWPGNVRQLENTMERVVMTAPEDGKVSAGQIPEEISSEKAVAAPSPGLSFEQVMRDAERDLLQRSLIEAGGNKKLASLNLNLPYSTFRNKLDKLNIS